MSSEHHLHACNLLTFKILAQVFRCSDKIKKNIQTYKKRVKKIDATNICGVCLDFLDIGISSISFR